MEFDLSFNFISIFSIILLLFATIITVFQRLKLRWPVKVNCWFCNNNTKIWRQQLNWWMCPNCEQYNGFSKNGDYAFNIPEQYKTSPNEIKRYCTIKKDTATGKAAKNGLCKRCNMNETLKISKLSDYIPENNKNYEYEIKQFKNTLEQQYPLCAKCKVTVNNVLFKQALWLAQYKMLLFKQKPFCIIANNTKYVEPVCRLISIIFSSMIAYNMESIFLPIGGLFFQFCTCWATTKRRNSDILLMFLWICTIMLLPFKDTKLIKIDLQNLWFSLEYVTQYHMIILFISVIGIINVMPKSHKKKVCKNISFKKIESFAKNTVLPDLCIATSNNKHSFKDKTTGNLNGICANQLSLNTTKEYIPSYLENSINCKPTVFQSSFTNREPQLSPSIHDNSAAFNSTPPIYKKSTMDNSYLLNDSLSTLSGLSLGEDKPKYAAKTPKIFETKVYGTKSLELFKKSGKRYILSPPKLKSVTQTSWVAGGYWQEGIEPPSLSRSSSQSSGFGSVGSNFGPSREASVHEFDQCSVMSDTTQSCYTLRQTNSPVGSFCQQSLHHYPSSELRNQSINNQTIKLGSPNLCTSQTLLFSQNNKRNNSSFMDQCSQGQSTNVNDTKSSSEMQTFPSHTTIVTSPVWLPALLCGSLVLNIIVLCTTLLR